MSKLGRYSADRKKVEELSADKTVEVAECGTIFMLASGSADYSVTLPTVADAGQGWWAKFVLKTTNASNTDQVDIKQSTSDSNEIVNVTVLCGDQSDEVVGSGPVQIAADGVTFDISACVAGDTVELFTNGTKWYGQAITSGSAGVVKFDA